MKIISLNVWGGKIFKPLQSFITQHAEDTDIFCFQEIFATSSAIKEITENKEFQSGESGPRANLLAEIEALLPGFTFYYSPIQEGFDYYQRVNFNLTFGLLTAIRKDISILSSGEKFVYRFKNSRDENDNRSVGRNVQYFTLDTEESSVSLVNFHGLWNGQGKIDTPDRLMQSTSVKEILENLEGKKILVGDFNLLPDTESLSILEKGMRNLIKEYNYSSTRSNYYLKPGKFADYILVSTDVIVKDFSVLNDQVSDHLPMVLDIS